MDITRKDATITPTGSGDDFPGTFEVILSAPTKDRDGDTLHPEDWKQPLPDHITFDSDHGMSVATTVGSGVPRIDDETGNLIVSGTYSSLPRAQEVRTLVNEGHIRTTSVAFMSEKTEKDGATATTRELLNGAFVAIPSNREALVLSSKGVKAGARNSASDLAGIQEIHDTATALGADCSGAKSASLTADDFKEAVEAGVVTASEMRAAFGMKDADAEDASDPATLAQAVDASIDEAIDLLAAVDATSLPAEVQQAIALIQAADAAVDELLDAIGVPDPDEDDSADAAGAPKSAAAAATTAAAADVDASAADDADLTLRVRSLSALADSYTSRD